ncbi:MAG: helix-turn-helix transcriptional regulator [Phascolarctobacterium sp.]|nr:helix-turn-helix transcriptional regulator [Phascolarctobacterium sp.]
MNKELLKYHILKNGDTVKTLAAFLGLHAGTLYKKISGESDFSTTEVAKIAKKYDLSDSLVVDIFLH